MASYTPQRSTHQTLTPATADTVSLRLRHQAIEVLNRDATGVIYVREDGTTAVVGADDNFIVTAGQSLVIPTDPTTTATLTLISSTACAYSVTGIS
jgi:hypothetical protein